MGSYTSARARQFCVKRASVRRYDRCETFAFAFVATRRGCLRRDERVLK